MSRRDRTRRPSRRPAFREPRARFLVVTEGEVTEPLYLSGFVAHWRNLRVEVKCLPSPTDPKTLVAAARDVKRQSERAAAEDSNQRFDQIWAMFDVDEHAHLPAAREMARANGIHLAVSNPCFELWLLLHFRDGPGQQTREKVRSLLREHAPAYDKRLTFAECAAGYDDAVRRAQQLDRMADACGTPGHNPSTGAYRLMEAIREAGPKE